MRTSRRIGLSAAIVMAAIASFCAVAPSPPGAAYPGAPWFQPGLPYDQNFPDPHIVAHDGAYYAYATNTGGPRLPILNSTDLETWYAREQWSPNPWNDDPWWNDGLIRAASWAAPIGSSHELWAPAVVFHNGKWMAYFGMRERHAAVNRYCVTVATADHPNGPFFDDSSEPITCGVGRAGAIDPWVHVDNTGTYLIWKTEPFSIEVPIFDIDISYPASIWAQPMTADGRSVNHSVEATIILSATGGWEDGNVENPAMFVDDGELFLTYSGNHWAATEYATGLARCSSALGPCTRVGNGPIIAADGVKGGPGGAATFRDHSDQLHIVYHAWNHPFSNYPQWPQCDTDNDGKCIDQGQRFMHVQVMCRMPNGAFHVGLPAGWSFCDAPPGTWFEHGVSWLADTGATTGVASYHFDPDGELTRAQAMTFLWRWAGEPAPTQPSPFTDVEPGTFYEQAVRWAAEIGLTTGTTATTFSPDQIIDRAQLATILHRVSGLIEPAGPSPFTDVLADTWYTDAVAWMVEAGVTTGLSNTEFGPQQTTTRAQFATFLCRYSRLDPAAPSAVPAVQACS